MESIVLTNLIKQGNKVIYVYETSVGLSGLLKKHTDFFIEYDFSIEYIPNSILIVPFLSTLLPVSWVLDLKIIVTEADSTFITSIPQIKRGYQDMYPHINFKGKLICKKNIPNNQDKWSREGLFFSGGVDATYSLLKHLSQKPLLITIWGADISLRDEVGWQHNLNNIKATATSLAVPHTCIKSNFRNLILEHYLEKKCPDIKKHGGWWYGFMHGIAILGHGAPVSFHYKVKTLYIGSSYTITQEIEENRKHQCASDPSLDNHFAVAGTVCVHDGYLASRFDKINFICSQKLPLKLHVCWVSKGGENCCLCEKCCRTILAIAVAGYNPTMYGFTMDNEIMPKIQTFLNTELVIPKNLHFDWSILNAESEKGLVYPGFEWFSAVHLRYKEAVFKKHFTSKIKTTLQRELARLHHKIDDYLHLANAYLTSRRLPRRIFLIGTPSHGNMGDHAISLGELLVLQQKYGTEAVVEIPYHIYKHSSGLIQKIVQPNDNIYIQGGGNLGSLYPAEEQLHQHIVSTFKDNKIIILPQSIFFAATAEGQKILKESQAVYRNHPNLTIMARDRNSFSKARKFFSSNTRLLVPDMANALWQQIDLRTEKRAKIALFLRQDGEKMLDDNTIKRIKYFLFDHGLEYTINDTFIEKFIQQNNRLHELKKILQIFMRSKFIITDRFHGMIFAVLTGTPVLVFNSLGGKITYGAEWFAKNKQVWLVDTDHPEEIQKVILELWNENSYISDNAVTTALLYKALKDID